MVVKLGTKRKLKGSRPQRINGHDRFEHQWWVPSATDPSKEYKVSEDEQGNWLCSCPAFIFQKRPIAEKRPCKHIQKVKANLESRSAAARKAHATMRARRQAN